MKTNCSMMSLSLLSSDDSVLTLSLVLLPVRPSERT